MKSIGVHFPRMSPFYPFINVETYTVNLVTYGHVIMRTPPCDHNPITDLKDLSDIEVLSNKNGYLACSRVTSFTVVLIIHICIATLVPFYGF